MAHFFLHSKHFSRGNGAKVTYAAAYRAGERIADQRSGKVYTYSDRQDIPYKEVFLPEDLAGRPDMSWAYNRDFLWNAVEKAAKRKNAALARELLVNVPSELSEAQRAALVRRFGSELANRYRTAVDVCLHLPRPQADERHHHAHLLMSTREVGPWGFGQRTTLELQGVDRWRRGLQNTQKAEFMGVRERWAQLVNETLRDAGLDVRVDARSLADQGIDREPVPRIPASVKYLEAKSGPSAAGDGIRRLYAERVAAREQGPQELARVLERQKQEKVARIQAKAAAEPRRSPKTPEELVDVRRERGVARALGQDGADRIPDRVPERPAEPNTERAALERTGAQQGEGLQQNKTVIDLGCDKPAAEAAEVCLGAGVCEARRKAEARREKWAVLEAQRVMELRRLEQARKQVPAADAGLERSAHAVRDRRGDLEEAKSLFRREGLDLEI